MSLTDLPRDPEPLTATIGDDVLDSLAPSYSPADVDELRSLVHGPVYAAGDDGMAAEVATWNVAVQHTPAIAVGRHLRRRRRRRRLLGHRPRPRRRRPGHRPRAGPQRGRLGDDHHPPHAGPVHRPGAPGRPRRGRRQVDPRPRGGRRVRSRRAVRLVVRRRRRRLHPRRRHGLARPQARLLRRPRRGPSRSSPPTAGCTGSARRTSRSCSGPSAAARATSAS